jgi:hypothetical protein
VLTACHFRQQNQMFSFFAFDFSDVTSFSFRLCHYHSDQETGTNTFRMSEEITYTKRYIYNLDPLILQSLETLYFDSITYEQRTHEDFIQRRKEELITETPEVNASRASIVVQPKPKVDKRSIEDALSNLKISKSEENAGREGKGDGEVLPKKESDSEGESSELNTETESEVEESDRQLNAISEEAEINPNVNKSGDVNGADNDEYESTVSFMTTRSPLVLFKSSILQSIDSNKVFGVYKTTLDAIDSPNFDPLATLRGLTYNAENPMPKDPMTAGISAIFMLSAGHFAGAIVSHLPHSTKGNKGSAAELQLQSVRLLAHKTFHRYTTRKKQGGAQSAMDDAKGKANSAGSTLRRYNEQALGNDIEELMEEWKPLLEKCDSIFIRGSGKGGKNARGTGLIVRDAKDPKAIIKHGDKRVKMIPFVTKRPTTVELKRAWVELTYLKVVDLPIIAREEIEKRKRRDAMLSKSKEATVEVKSNEEAIKFTNEVVTLLRKSKAPALVLFYKKNKAKFDVNTPLQPIEQYAQTPTALHFASKKALPFMVQTLLVQLHADATVVNAIEKTAYDIAGDKDTRYAFRIARNLIGEENGTDWEATHIGSGMTKEEVDTLKTNAKQQEHEREASEKEEIKKQHESIVEQIRVEEAGKKRTGPTLGSSPGIVRVTEEQKLVGLTDAQKMKILREQRFRAIEARLKNNSSNK